MTNESTVRAGAEEDVLDLAGSTLDSVPLRPGVEIIQPKSFEPEQHFYTRVLNATMHPLVSYFMHLTPERLVSRYCHLHPQVDVDALKHALQYEPRYLKWGGVDLFNVTTAGGIRQMVVIETNSCPAGLKSMPLFIEFKEQGGYQVLVQQAFSPALARHRFKEGGLAVLYDKNYMEASGYAAAMADVFESPVYLVPFFDSEPDRPARFSDGVLEVRTPENEWVPIRGAIRYVTQRPWNRIPLVTRTFIFNPIVACLAGGRNKMVAAMAYDFHNAELLGSGLKIRTPETFRDVDKREVPLMVKRFGGQAVVKVPYSNAGQGVFTITNKAELDRFMEMEFPYTQFIVQSLIGDYHWSSTGGQGKFFHVGTVPDRNNQIYVADMRMMLVGTEAGLRPLALYARRAPMPLPERLDTSVASWSVLGTNLSVKKGPDLWDVETSRLLLMDRKDFNKLGLGLDDLIKAFIQSVLAVTAIDQMACTLMTQKGTFKAKLFRSLNKDRALLDEIMDV